MKRFHVHVAVDDLRANIRFYSTLFGAPPTVEKSDDRELNERTTRASTSRSPDAATEPVSITSAFKWKRKRSSFPCAARSPGPRSPLINQPDAACCYARSDKYCNHRPAGDRLGNVSHARFRAGVRRYRPRATGGGEGGVLRTRWRRHSTRQCRRLLPVRPAVTQAFNVLFLCTGNSARSISWPKPSWRLNGKGRFNAFSAGSSPAGRVNPLTIELLHRNGLPTDGLRSKRVGGIRAARGTLPALRIHGL